MVIIIYKTGQVAGQAIDNVAVTTSLNVPINHISLI